MSTIKKVLLFGVVLPVLIAFFNSYFASPSVFSWGNDHSKTISFVALFVALFSSIFITIKSFRSSPSPIWKLLSIVLILIFAAWIYLGLNFSPGF